MTLFRVEAARRSRAREAFSGEGGLHAAGRWNSAGTRIVYASASLSLACLEKRVHLAEAPEPGEYVYFRITVPETAIRPTPALPARWAAQPPPAATARVGDGWIRSGESVGLRVPSAIIPQEWNVLLNPVHPGFPWESIEGPFDFTWDGRIFG